MLKRQLGFNQKTSELSFRIRPISDPKNISDQLINISSLILISEIAHELSCPRHQEYG